MASQHLNSWQWLAKILCFGHILDPLWVWSCIPASLHHWVRYLQLPSLKLQRRNRTGLVSTVHLTHNRPIFGIKHFCAWWSYIWLVKGVPSMVIIRTTVKELYDGKHAKRESGSWKLWARYLDRLLSCNSTAPTPAEYGNYGFWAR